MSKIHNIHTDIKNLNTSPKAKKDNKIRAITLDDAPPNNTALRIKTMLQNLPNLPGVYKMLDKNGAILYVGKAKSLKNRVSSYFNKTHEHPKTAALVARIDDIEIIVVRSETEALLLEQNLIKQHKPPYNILLRDDKSYLYLYLSKDKYPRIDLGRGKANHDASRVFGPYPSSTNAKQMVLLIQKMFMLRVCKNYVFLQQKRPCLEYQIKRCSAPCVNLVQKSVYDENVLLATKLLTGQTHDVQDAITQKMTQAASTLQFELAAFYRDKLTMISEIQARQAVYKDAGDADVMAAKAHAGVFCVHVLTVRKGQVLGGKNYFIDDVAHFDGEHQSEQLLRFIMSFYRQVSDDMPKNLVLSCKLDDAKAAAEALSLLHGDNTNQRINIQHHVRGDKKAWLDIATLNAKNALEAKLADYFELQRRFLALSAVLFDLRNAPIDTIECFDISHTMGEATIASCVVCDSAGLRRRSYRQYAIHGIKKGDDYAAMQQALTRRYQKQPLPDVLLIDGGRGQLSSAKAALDLLDVDTSKTLLIGVAKGEGRRAGLEVLHFLAHQPIDLPAEHKALHLITHIRNEAHRFAITAHRKKRDKARAGSVLELIPGLGATRRRDLLTHFGGMQQLLSASKEEIASVKGIGKVLSNTIYNTLHA